MSPISNSFFKSTGAKEGLGEVGKLSGGLGGKLGRWVNRRFNRGGMVTEYICIPNFMNYNNYQQVGDYARSVTVCVRVF